MRTYTHQEVDVITNNVINQTIKACFTYVKNETHIVNTKTKEVIDATIEPNENCKDILQCVYEELAKVGIKIEQK